MRNFFLTAALVLAVAVCLMTPANLHAQSWYYAPSTVVTPYYSYSYPYYGYSYYTYPYGMYYSYPGYYFTPSYSSYYYAPGYTTYGWYPRTYYYYRWPY